MIEMIEQEGAPVAHPPAATVGLEAVRLVHRRARVGDGRDRVGTGLEDQLLGIAEVAPEVVELLDLRTREAGGHRVGEALA